MDGGGSRGASYKLFGSAPNRVLVVQWNSLHVSSLNSHLVFQDRLYENGNMIEVYYDTVVVPSVFSGLIAVAVSRTNFVRIVPGTPPTLAYTENASVDPPAAGTLYRLVPVNRAPTITVPGGLTVPGDTDHPLPGVSVADVDVGSQPLKVTLSVSHGTLTLPTRNGLSFITGDGDGDGTQVFTGTLAHINAALATLRYRANEDYGGAESPAIRVDDDATANVNGAQAAATTLSITVNRRPIAAADSYAAPPNGPLAVSVANGTLKNDTDADSAVLSAKKGSDPAHGDMSYRPDGSFSYTPHPNYTGPDSFTYTALDGVGESSVTTVSLTVLNTAVSISDTAVPEGKAAGTTANFSVRLSAATTYPVTVRWKTDEGTAKAGQDYQAQSGTLTFEANQTAKTVSVPILSDGINEGNEAFTVTLTQPENATLGRTVATGTIVDDDDTTPSFSIDDASVTEGNGGTASLLFTVRLSPRADGAVTVKYATADGTAKVGQDYDAANGTLMFQPGDQAKTVTVVVRGDTTVEPNESLAVTLSDASGGATVGRATATGTVVNDDIPVEPQAPQACSPRPRVRTEPTAGGGKLQVRIEATPMNTQVNNPLQRLTFGAFQNAKVTMNGQAVSSGQTLTVPAGVVFVDFTVERVTAGQASTVHLTVVDGCGSWTTFVGGGTGAGF